jgi:hypothetical protein
MITCKIGDRTYSVDFISGRALREIGPAADMYSRLVKIAIATEADNSASDANHDGITVQDALDTMVKWFCILFGNQFTPDDVYDKYPVDRLTHDIALALMAVQTQTTSALNEFPTIPVTQEAERLMSTTERTPPTNP